MPYSTESDVRLACGGAEQLRQVSDQNGDGYVDDDVIARAISRADGLIDKHMAKQWAVPFTNPVIEDVRNLSAELAAYFLRSWKGMLTEADVTAHKLHLAELEALAKGDTVPTDPPPAPASTRIDKSSTRPSSMAVSRRALRGFW